MTVSDVDESIAFYEAALRPLGIAHVLDYDGRLGPPGHPDLKGFGCDNRIFFWLRHGSSDPLAVHIGFVARSNAEVDAFHVAAIRAGAVDDGSPGYRDHYDPRYYAANILDPDGQSIEVVYKSWQHAEA